MISVIVSTHKPDFLQQFTLNLAQTIGVKYELIAIENNAKYSICEAYNIGFKRSKYNYLCFVHEDVIFKTMDWGKRLILIMENDLSVGLVGVAGTKFKSTYPLSGWGQGPILAKFKRGHIYHQLENNVESYLNFDENIDCKEIEDVVCLDGVFLFSKKEVFTHCRFDDKMLTHFHGYDSDISLQVFFQSYRVLVDRGIKLLHYSGGNYTVDYTNANKKIWKKWISKLPVVSRDLNMTRFQLYKIDSINFLYSFVESLKRKLRI